MKRDGFLCQPCKRHGRTTKAEQVDHKTPRSAGGSDKDSNLEAICIPCHKYKTQQEALDGRKSGV
jgi:5-methylcytosine-specific restriction protein A